MGPSAEFIDLTSDDDTRVHSTAQDKITDNSSNAIVHGRLAKPQPAGEQRPPSTFFGDIEYINLDSDEEDESKGKYFTASRANTSSKGNKGQTSNLESGPSLTTHFAQSFPQTTPKSYKLSRGLGFSTRTSPDRPLSFKNTTQPTPKFGQPIPTKVPVDEQAENLVFEGSPFLGPTVGITSNKTALPERVSSPTIGALPLPDGNSVPLAAHETTEVPMRQSSTAPSAEPLKSEQNTVNKGKGPSIIIQKSHSPSSPFVLPMRRPSEAVAAISSKMDHIHIFTTVLKKHLQELRNDTEAMMKLWLPKNRLRQPKLPPLDSPKESASPCGMMGFRHSTSPFADMKPIQSVSPQDHAGSTVKLVAVSIGVNKNGKQNKVSQAMTVPTTVWRDDFGEVPSHMQYTSISQNVLGTNTKQLQAWPYFGEDVVDDATMNAAVRAMFDVVADDRPRKVLISQQARTFAPYFEAFLEEIECSMDDVLRFLLEIAEGDDGLSNRLLEAANHNEIPAARDNVTAMLNARDKYCEHDFDRTSQRWVSVLSGLSPTDFQGIWKAGIACNVFAEIAKFSPWQIARLYARIPQFIEGADDMETTETYTTIACRICHLHDCPYHGSNTEHPNGEESDLESVGTVDRNDFEHPPRMNYKQRVTIPVTACTNPGGSGEDVPGTKAVPNSISWWLNEKNSVASNHDKRGPFFPCNHPGSSCSTARCTCWITRVMCEKACGCATDCNRRFRGCSCSNGKRGRRICLQDDNCACFRMNRECDPDLCGSCGVDEILDSVNRYNDDIGSKKCGNAAIQLGRPKRTLLGNSVIHGFGLYAGEPIKKDDFVGEYKGEIISLEETERRGVIYEYQNLSYIFDLNKYQRIDSQRMGNKIRYINHAATGKNSLRNLVPKIVFCNMAHRVAMYAIKDISIGDELFFDYGSGYHEKLFSGQTKEKTEKQNPISRTNNPSLIKDFVEPSKPARKSNDYEMSTIEEEEQEKIQNVPQQHDDSDNDEDDDDRPRKRVRASRQPVFNIKGPRPPPKLRLAARKTQDRPFTRQDSSNSLNERLPGESTVPTLPRQKAAVKSGQKMRVGDAAKGTSPSKQAARKGKVPMTRGHKSGIEDDGYEDGDEPVSDYESSVQEDSDSEDDAPPIQRRSGRKRQKARRLMSES